MGANADRQLLVGTIERLHPNGLRFKLAELQDYLQLSKWPDQGTMIPPAGTRVRLALDSGGFVRAIEALDPSAVVTGPSNRAGGPSIPKVAPGGTLSPTDPFLRATALQCAVEHAKGGPWSNDARIVCDIAEAFLSWLALRPERTEQEIDFRV